MKSDEASDGNKVQGEASDDRKAQEDRRRVERAAIDLQVDFRTEEMQVDFQTEEMKEMFIYSYATDISGLGIFIHHKAPFVVGTRILVRFVTPEGALEVQGEVRWISPFNLGPITTREPGMGVQFIDPPQGLKARLQALVGGTIEIQD